MKHIKMKYGFTLIELLVVVIIIAVLSAVAVPMYKHAALKSRFSKVMPVAKSIVEAQEVYYLGKNIYAANDEKDLLDVAPSGATTIELATRDQENQYNYVAASSSEVPGARYIMYQKHSPKFANTIQCEADENNPQAVWLCSKGLNGQLIDGSVNTAQGSYVTYLLSGTKGSGDTLPTSMMKLKAQICANISEENCIVDEQNKTITTTECTGFLNEGRTCINRTYNETGTPIDYEKRKTKCANPYYRCNITYSDEQNVVTRQETSLCYTSNATFDNNNGTCTPNHGVGLHNLTAPYFALTVEGGNGNTMEYCVKFENGVCTESEKFFRYTTPNDPYSPGYSVACASSKPNDDFTCNTGEWLQKYEINYNDQRTKISEVYIEPIDDNDTTFYNTGTGGKASTSSLWNDLSEDGLTILNRTRPSYSGENVTFTTTNLQTNQVTNTVTCAITNANWQTGTCKPGTAIE